ncbi:MAG TPA: chorismate mutase [Candidatus Angelobacter sp.]|nr:chorismate mutase [Candidatus Angelobacter sp.]
MDQDTDQSTVNGHKTLGDWRRQIDALDSELLRLLNQRAAIACEIAAIKVASGLPAYDGNRERQVLARVVEKNTGPLDEQSVTDIFSGIIRETRRLGTQRMEAASKIPNPELAEGEGSLQSSGTAEQQQLHSAKRESFP